MSKPLSARQRILAESKAKGMTDADACKKAGYKAKSVEASCNQIARMMSNDEFKGYYDELMSEAQKSTVMTVAGKLEMLERIAKAQEQGDPRVSIAAIAEENKMTGGYEPERMKIEFEVNIGGDGEDSES